jgi:hypothetical protein
MDERSPAQQMVPASPQSLVARSAGIVARGLRDLARDSNWLVKKVFSARASHLAISPAGQVSALAPLVRQGVERIWLHDIDLAVPASALALPQEPAACPAGLPAAFALSPSGRHLAAAWGAWPPQLQVFDLHAKMFLGSFGDLSLIPQSLAWSASGMYFAAASQGGAEACLRVWKASATQSPYAMPFSGSPVAEAGVQQGLSALAAIRGSEAESSDEGTFAGFGLSAFSPDDETLAVVARMEGEWADDAILFLNLPELRRQKAFQAQGRVTGLTWAFDSRQIVFCSAGQSYRITAETTEPEPLPFGAELCACHPNFSLCLCFSSWLRNSAKGRLFLADLDTLAIFDEYPAEGVVDVRWSLDGSRAYAMTADGLAYMYEPPLF